MAINFDNLFNKAKDMAITAGKAAEGFANEVVDTSKTKIEEVKINSKIDDVLSRLGAVVYDSRKNGKDSEKLVAMLVNQLDALYAELDAFEKKNEAKSAKKVCPNCGKENDVNAVFCGACGAKLAEVKAEEVEEKAEEKTEECCEACECEAECKCEETCECECGCEEAPAEEVKE